jgi:hypothetical protein
MESLTFPPGELPLGTVGSNCKRRMIEMKHVMVILVALVMMAGPIASVSDTSILVDSPPSYTNVNGGPFVAISDNTIRLIDSDGTNGNMDHFIIKHTVMDSDGNTYIAGNIANDKLLLGELPIIDLNDGINRSSTHHSPVIAKMAPDGQWLWATVPVPTTGDECSNAPLSQTDGAIMGLALSHDEEELAVVGEFEGCYKLQEQTLLASGDNDNGLVLKLSATSGSLDWMVNLATQASSISTSWVRLNAVHFSSDDSTLFVGGQYSGSLPSRLMSGGKDLHSDMGSDGYIGIIDAEDGAELSQQDSCIDNDAGDISEDCGVLGYERVVSIEVDNGEVYFFTETLDSSTPFTLFGSDEMSTSSSGKRQSYAWNIQENSPYQDVSSSAITFGLDDDSNHLLHSSAVMNGVVYALIQTGSPLGYELIVGDATANTSIHITSATPSIIPYGFVQGFGTDTYVVYSTASPADYTIVSHDGVTIESSRIGGDIGFLSVESNYTQSIEINGEFDAYQALTVAGGDEYVSFFGTSASMHKAAVVAYDNDGDGIPNTQDIHINVPSHNDIDNDGIEDRDDNCRYIWNTDQLNFDSDENGDACDTDIDGDGVLNSIPLNFSDPDHDDACPYVYAGVPNDIDRDGCIDDLDADGVPDDQDLCPGHDDNIDDDLDGLADGCDDYPDDSDNDGVINSIDNCPANANANQTDMDNDELGDACDNDLDGDGINNHVPFDDSNTASDDQCPYTNASNNDDDQDGCLDSPVPNDDLDGDGVTNVNDACPGANDTADSDGDSIPDACDDDIDGDGVNNSVPLNLSDSSNDDSCPYVDATGQDEDNDGCVDQTEQGQCSTCNTTAQTGVDDATPVLDPDDTAKYVVVGGTGIVGGGLLSLLLRRLRVVGKYVDFGDGLELVRHLPKRKRKDENADHYFRRGLVRQREMTLSADKNLDDYIEGHEGKGDGTNE